MSTAETIATEPLGAPGETCAACAAPLAPDQRYCLECGHRRASSRVPYAQLLSGREAGEVLGGEEPPDVEPQRPRRQSPPLLAGAVGAAAALLLGVGVAIGVLVGGSGEQPAPVIQPVAQEPPIVNITNTGVGGEPVTAEFSEDWPPGESGFTVQLELLPKDGADPAAVEAAKSAAESKGAAEVGALDSDGFSSLKPGSYLIYSGVYTGKGAKGEARAALRRLRKDFPDAKVVRIASTDAAFAVEDDLPEEEVQVVDDAALQDLQGATGEEQQKKSAQLPDTLGTGGAPPTPDRAPPGGGSDAEAIE